jgi:hypothetical protein
LAPKYWTQQEIVFSLPHPQPQATVQQRREEFKRLKALGLISSTRAESKREQDDVRVRDYVEGEKRFLEVTAHRDNVPGSPGRGDVVALFNSKGLDVDEGDVLRNSKRRYVHPSIKKFLKSPDFDITKRWAEDVRAEMP